MLEIHKVETRNINNPTIKAEGDIQKHLRTIIDDYLAKHPKLTLNGLSQRCAVSEPTLRRVCKGQIKTCPSPITIADILSYTGKTSDIDALAQLYPGPATQYLKEKMSQVSQEDSSKYSEELNENLHDPTKYLIYTLAAQSDEGLSEDKIAELFGSHGIQQAEALESKGLLILERNLYRAKTKNFLLSTDLFKNHFKALADFIKPHKLPGASRTYSPLFTNYSSSINRQAYASIVRIQRQALKQIHKILTDKSNSGNIPTFVLSAVDTLDTKSADEFHH